MTKDKKRLTALCCFVIKYFFPRWWGKNEYSLKIISDKNNRINGWCTIPLWVDEVEMCRQCEGWSEADIKELIADGSINPIPHYEDELEIVLNRAHLGEDDFAIAIIIHEICHSFDNANSPSYTNDCHTKKFGDRLLEKARLAEKKGLTGVADILYFQARMYRCKPMRPFKYDLKDFINVVPPTSFTAAEIKKLDAATDKGEREAKQNQRHLQKTKNAKTKILMNNIINSTIHKNSSTSKARGPSMIKSGKCLL